MIGRSLKSALALAAIAALVTVTACSSSGDKPKPADLPQVSNLLAIKLAWSVPLAAPGSSFELTAVGSDVLAASREGTVLRVNAATGEVRTRASVERGIQAAVGASENVIAVVNQQNEVLAIDRAGAVLWRARLPSQVAAAPLVTRDSVIVLSADQVITSYALQSGTRQWNTSKPASGLALNRAGGLVQIGETVYVGLPAGKLAAYTPTGSQRWEVNAMGARGANEIERLTDLIGRPAIEGSDLCVRSFQAGVSCINGNSGRALWQRKANGFTAVAADGDHVYFTESNGEVIAHARATGESRWNVDRFRYRSLSAPRVIGRNLAFGDADGNLHILDKKDGSNVARIGTDGSAIVTQPLVVGQTLVVRTQNGLFGFTAQ